MEKVFCFVCGKEINPGEEYFETLDGAICDECSEMEEFEDVEVLDEDVENISADEDIVDNPNNGMTII